LQTENYGSQLDLSILGLITKLQCWEWKLWPPESWGKNLGVIWAVSCDGVCGVFNIHNFLKI